jgi:hypothetical protein
MRGLDDFDLPAGNGVTIARDDEPAQFAGPTIFERLRHCGRRLARTDDDRAAFRRRRQVRRKTMGRLRRADRRVEHPPQQEDWRKTACTIHRGRVGDSGHVAA